MCKLLLELGGISLPVSFYFPDTARYFAGYGVPASEGPAISIPDWYWDQWTRELREANAHGEYSAMAAVCSAALFPFDRFVFHAAAVSVDGRAWLIAAPSGVGKTTIAGRLCALWAGNAGIISGDRPVLRIESDGSVIVCPSPWNGKEDWRGAPEARLAGTVLLRRGEKNSLRRMDKKNAAARTYIAVLQTAADGDMLRGAAAMTEALLNAAPAYDLVSADPEAAAALLFDHIRGGGENGI